MRRWGAARSLSAVVAAAPTVAAAVAGAIVGDGVARAPVADGRGRGGQGPGGRRRGNQGCGGRIKRKLHQTTLGNFIQKRGDGGNSRGT